MEATFRALCTHGYPDTTIATIADEFEKSQSLIYYHYDDKRDLIGDFLRYMLRQFEAEFESIDSDEPAKRLDMILDHLIPADVTDEQLRFRRALFEMRSQAPYVTAYHDQFEQTDALVLEALADTIEMGIETGTFRAMNAQETAEFIYSTVSGALERASTLDDPCLLERHRDLIDEYVDARLIDDSDRQTRS